MLTLHRAPITVYVYTAITNRYQQGYAMRVITHVRDVHPWRHHVQSAIAVHIEYYLQDHARVVLLTMMMVVTRCACSVQLTV